MGWRDRLLRLLAIISLAWCLLIGIWIWLTPGFPEASSLGPVPLIVPVTLAALATWAVWGLHHVALAVATVLLVGFTVLAGFSIGIAYIPPAGMLALAVIIAARAKPVKDYSADSKGKGERV